MARSGKDKVVIMGMWVCEWLDLCGIRFAQHEQERNSESSNSKLVFSRQFGKRVFGRRLADWYPIAITISSLAPLFQFSRCSCLPIISFGHIVSGRHSRPVEQSSAQQCTPDRITWSASWRCHVPAETYWAPSAKSQVKIIFLTSADPRDQCNHLCTYIHTQLNACMHA